MIDKLEGVSVTDIASPTTYAASGFALVASVTLNEWVALVSITVAVGTLLINWYYKHMQLKVARQQKDK